MLQGKLLEELNQQIKYELYSAHLYLAMAAYCHHRRLPGFAHFFEVQADEERYHAMKMFHFVDKMGGRIKIYGLEEPEEQFGSMKDVFGAGLKHEQWVSSRIRLLSELANAENDEKAVEFLQWYIDEQVEEEESFSRILGGLEQCGDDHEKLKALDDKLGQRTFNAPDPHGR